MHNLSIWQFFFKGRLNKFNLHILWCLEDLCGYAALMDTIHSRLDVSGEHCAT